MLTAKQEDDMIEQGMDSWRDKQDQADRDITKITGGSRKHKQIEEEILGELQ